MKKLTVVFSLIAVLFVSTMATGANLTVPFYFDSATVLPQGVRTLRYNYFMGEGNDMFGPSGKVVGLGNPMNVDVSYQEFIDAQDTDVEKGVLKGYLTRHGRDMNSLAGKTTGTVNVELNAQVPIFAWGITEKWTMGAVIPIVTLRTHMDTGFVANSDLQKIANQLVDEGKGFKAKEVKSKTDAVIPDKNDKYGYKPFVSPLSHREETSLGDIRIVNKVQLFSNDRYAVAFINELMLPTGRTADIHRAIDVPTGDGQFDLHFGAVGQYFFR